jgi:hypothetical protein
MDALNEGNGHVRERVGARLQVVGCAHGRIGGATALPQRSVVDFPNEPPQ